MKACDGFILRHIVGEYILMPTGDNIAKFSGAVLMNEMSAFIWEQMQVPVTRDELLERIMDRYEVDSRTAALDLDALLADLKLMGIVEE